MPGAALSSQIAHGKSASARNRGTTLSQCSRSVIRGMRNEIPAVTRRAFERRFYVG
jgi:hypothetical protein